MRNSLLFASVGAVLATLCYVKTGIAADSTTKPVVAADLQATIAAGDAEAGKAASTVCAACHGADGVSAIPANPSLAGQGAPYLLKQLMEFKSGARDNAVMAGMVANLDQTAMENLAAFYAGQKPAQSASTDENLKLGRDIYRGGIGAIGVPACASCHGPAGAGNDAAKFPRLAGQHAEYTAAALQQFRSGARANDVNRMMQSVASRLSDTEIAALANYIQGLY